MQIRIVGTQLPGRDCGAGDNFPGYSNIQVGVQRKNSRDEPADVLAAAAASGTLVATLGLTDAKGNPLCARVKPPQIEWSASETR